MSRSWVIPENAEKPTTNKQVTHRAKGGNYVSTDNMRKEY